MNGNPKLNMCIFSYVYIVRSKAKKVAKSLGYTNFEVSSGWFEKRRRQKEKLQALIPRV